MDKEINIEEIEKCFTYFRAYDLEKFKLQFVMLLELSNKSELSKCSGVGRRTIYDMIKNPISVNPNIETVFSLLSHIEKLNKNS